MTAGPRCMPFPDDDLPPELEEAIRDDLDEMDDEEELPTEDVRPKNVDSHYYHGDGHVDPDDDWEGEDFLYFTGGGLTR